jgi:hypothetical protein
MHDHDTAQAALPAPDAEFAALAERAAAVGFTTVRLGRQLIGMHRPERAIFAGTAEQGHRLLDQEGAP